MNFIAQEFVCHSQPGGWRVAYAMLLAVLALAISPARAADLHTVRIGVVQPRCSAEIRAIATAVQPACMDVATFPHFGARLAREGDSLFVHAGGPYAEKKNRASLPTARCSAHGVNDNFPHGGMLEVNAAGAVRGSGAGISLSYVNGNPKSAGVAVCVGDARAKFVFAAGQLREVTKARAAGTTGPLVRLRGFNAEARRV